jgi:hypothetical protein
MFNQKLIFSILFISILFRIEVYARSSGFNTQFLSSFSLQDALFKGVAVQGNYAYLADDIIGLIVLDVHDPLNPTFISNLQIQQPYEFAHKIEILDNYCIMLIRPSSWPTPTAGGFRVYDISDPYNPSHITFRGVPGRISDWFFKGDTLFVATGTQGFFVFDLSNPISPVTLGHFNEILNIWHIAANNNYAYATASSDGLRIIDINDFTNMTQISALKPGGNVGAVSLHQNYTFIMNDGMKVVDITNPSVPQIATYMNFVGSRYCPKIYDNKLLANGELINIYDPLSPYKLSFIDDAEYYIPDAALKDSILYTIFGKAFVPSKLDIYQFDPTDKLIELKNFKGGERIRQNSSQNLQWDAYNLKKVNIKFSADNGNEWQSLGSNLNSGYGKFNITIPDVVSNNCLIKIEDLNDSTTYDISDSVFVVYDPSIKIYYPNGGEEFEVEMTDTIRWYLYQPSNVNINLDYSTDNGVSWQPIIHDFHNNVYYYVWQIPIVSSRQCLIKITDNSDTSRYDFSDAVFTIYDPTSISDDTEILSSNFQLLNAFPNPFNSSTTISFAMSKAFPVEINIYSTSGEKIYSKKIEYTHSGLNTFIWDGKDNSGREISSGLYFYSILSNKLKQYKKCILLK